MAPRTAEALALILLSACAPRDAESDASRDDAIVLEDATSIDAAACTLSPPDALPALGGDVVVLDPDAGFQIPAQAGGSPIGVWRVEHVTIYTRGALDPNASVVSGTAWVIVTSTEVELAIDLQIGTAQETLTLRGSYVLSDATLHVTPRCSMPATAEFDLDFTSGDSSGTLLATIGELTLLFRCARTST